jgi:hypothetical protein
VQVGGFMCKWSFGDWGESGALHNRTVFGLSIVQAVREKKAEGSSGFQRASMVEQAEFPTDVFALIALGVRLVGDFQPREQQFDVLFGGHGGIVPPEHITYTGDVTPRAIS